MVAFDSAAEDCQTLSTSRRTIYLSAIERHVSLDVYAAEPAMTDAAFIAAARAVAACVYPDMIVRLLHNPLARSRPRTPQLAEISPALSGSNPGKPRRAAHGPEQLPLIIPTSALAD
jgi:hypothetical protein